MNLNAPELESLEGVVALVTGGSRGLGFGIARAYAAAGASVWLVAEVEDELGGAADEIREEGGRVEPRVVDLADRRALRAFADELSREPALRVLVNNAAILERQALAELAEERWDETLAVNLTAPVLLTRELLPALTGSGGSIINVSSRAGIRAFGGQAAYCASKFGLEAFTRCLARELVGIPVSVNTVTPGLRIKPTSMTRSEADRLDPGERGEWHDPVALGPAFRFLAGLRGQVSGFRFDALTLSGSLDEFGAERTLERIHEVAEYVPHEYEVA
jgi:NAD(P)-dependent dehydrogenase (short-subunit alcohol dehydrogenase family)